MSGLDTADVRCPSPDTTVIGEAATRDLETTQDFKYFNCGELGHLKNNCRKNQSNHQRGSMPFGICQDVAETDIWQGNVEEQHPTENSPGGGGVLQAPGPGRRVLFLGTIKCPCFKKGCCETS